MSGKACRKDQPVFVRIAPMGANPALEQSKDENSAIRVKFCQPQKLLDKPSLLTNF
jgi:hypothetical protein